MTKPLRFILTIDPDDDLIVHTGNPKASRITWRERFLIVRDTEEEIRAAVTDFIKGFTLEPTGPDTIWRVEEFDGTMGKFLERMESPIVSANSHIEWFHEISFGGNRSITLRKAPEDPEISL